MSADELAELAADIRKKMITTMAKNGGHLASNLGVVELTIALHISFDCPNDSILWDVGHQCYTHKILTGRADSFDTIRTHCGLSGFPKPHESKYDAFIAGHSSSSISVADGMARAKKILGDNSYTVCVIGDGAMSGGIAFEALNNCAHSDEQLIIVLNDNEMSIGKSVGAVARNLTKMRNDTAYFKFKDRLTRFFESIPLTGDGLKRISGNFKDRVRDMFLHDNFFQKMGFTYLGPIDGHNIEHMKKLFTRAKQLNRPVIIHVNTVKGKGYEYAEIDPGTFHGVGKFDINTGVCETNSCSSYSKVMGLELTRLSEQDREICAVTAAMTAGTGMESMPKERLFDVGIAEEHAVSFTAGLANAGMKPVCAIYSTFLQRAYDQISQDICLANVHALLCIDRAGVVGEDGETHQGLFDVSFLTPMPNITVYSPSDREELLNSLNSALYLISGPSAIRYPRGEAKEPLPFGEVFDGFTVYRKQNAEAVIVTYGRERDEALAACEMLAEEGISADVISLCRIKPLPIESVTLAMMYKTVLFAEEGMMRGGINEEFARLLAEQAYNGTYGVSAVGIFVPQGTMKETLVDLALDGKSIAQKLREMLQ